jgi:type IV pilus assembly protein PilB
MPTVHGEDAVIRILDKEQINESFKNLDLDVVGFDPDDLRKFRRYIAEPLRDGAGDGTDRIR